MATTSQDYPAASFDATHDTQATWSDIRSWLRRHDTDVSLIARRPITLMIGYDDGLVYADLKKFIETAEGERQVDRSTMEPLVESVTLPFDLVPGEGAK